MSRVAVIGPGSVGCFFAAHLAAAGRDVTACARRPFDRYVVDSDEAAVSTPAVVVTSVDELDGSPFDWVLVAVKAHQSEGAGEWLDSTCGPESIVVALQNGTEAVERLRPLVNGAHVIPAVVYCGSELIAPGRIKHRSQGRLIVPDDAHGAALAALFEGTPADVDVRSDHLTAAWVKLGANVVANGLTALTRQPLTVFADTALAAVATDLLAEVWAVAIAEGAELDTRDPRSVIAGYASAGPDAGTSMYYDTIAGRVTEHDAIHGAAARAARRHGIATPVLDTVTALLACRAPA